MSRPQECKDATAHSLPRIAHSEQRNRSMNRLKLQKSLNRKLDFNYTDIEYRKTACRLLEIRQINLDHVCHLRPNVLPNQFRILFGIPGWHRILLGVRVVAACSTTSHKTLRNRSQREGLINSPLLSSFLLAYPLQLCLLPSLSLRHLDPPRVLVIQLSISL